VALWLEYKFTIYSIETDWRGMTGRGVYIFVNHFLAPKALYIGETRSFLDRLPDHEKWGMAIDLGMSQVHILSVLGSKNDREYIEKRLIRHYKPPLNARSLLGSL